MKKYLENFIAKKKDERSKLYERLESTEDIKEVRSIGETLKKLGEEIADAEAQLLALESEEPAVDEEQKADEQGEEKPEEEKPDEERADESDEEDPEDEEPTSEDVKRSKDWVKVDERNLNKVGSFGLKGDGNMNVKKTEERAKVMEQRGKALKEERAVMVSAEEILLPAHQSSQLAPAPFRQVSTFVDLTKVRNLQGGESYEAPFTVSYGEGGLTEEGQPYTEVETKFGSAKINKVKITAYAEISEELEKLPSADYAGEVQRGVEIALKKKMAREQICGTGASNSFMGITSTHADNTAVLVDDDLAIDVIDQDTLSKIIFNYGGDEEVEMKGVLVLTKADLLAFSLVRNAIGDKAYEIDLANQTINTVPYIINSNLTPLAKANDGDYCMVYGIPMYYETAIFSPVEMRKSYDYKFREGMIAIRASVFAGGNTTSYRGFMRIKKGASAVEEEVVSA